MTLNCLKVKKEATRNLNVYEKGRICGKQASRFKPGF